MIFRAFVHDLAKVIELFKHSKKVLPQLVLVADDILTQRQSTELLM